MGEFYYELLVSESSYKGKDGLTYRSKAALDYGTVVRVPIKNKYALAIVGEKVNKPTFPTKYLELMHISRLPKSSMDLINWFRLYYPAPISNITQLFLPGQISKKDLANLDSLATRAPVSTKKLKLPDLSLEQRQVLKNIEDYGTYLLHGDTGSGKTRVYLELVKKVMDQGKSAIILTPEISLTSQLYQVFQETFGDKVLVVHSRIKQTERRLTWLRTLYSDEPLIIIGARSAIFTPLKNIGLVVIDEAHEGSYKQDSSPYYQTARVAAKLTSLNKSVLILGSATPSVVDYFIAEQKNIPILRMKELAKNNPYSHKVLEIVDVKDRTNFTRNPYMSNQLLKSIEQALTKNEQSLIFLNRRGTARVILCQKCSWQFLCPNCDIPYTYHGDEHIAQCHVCGRKEKVPTSCPVCHYTDIIFKGVGTKAIVEELGKIFTKARIQRFDTDNKKSERFEQHYKTIRRGSIDILVGTQSIAKGLDLPRLGLVGMIAADSGLSIPDFSAQERLYQIVNQVIGRVGRGHREGKAIVQTFSPNGFVLKSAMSNDWLAFYRNEIAEREQFMYPPFCYLLKLSCKRTSRKSAQATATQFVDKLRKSKHQIDISGPAPSFHEKQGKKYVWQVVIKAKQRQELLKVIDSLPSGWSYDIDSINLL